MDEVFKMLFLALFVIAMAVRKIATYSVPKGHFLIRDRTIADFVLLFFDGLGMLLPFIYIFTDWLIFANYFIPEWISWLGVTFFVFAIWLIYRSHRDLGKNWSAVIGIKAGHDLVTVGVYRHIRHPMYAAHLIWAIAQIMMLHNWVAGFSFFIPMLLHYLIRSKKEERLLLDYFGNDYRAYMHRTGSIIPKFKSTEIGD